MIQYEKGRYVVRDHLEDMHSSAEIYLKEFYPFMQLALNLSFLSFLHSLALKKQPKMREKKKSVLFKYYFINKNLNMQIVYFYRGKKFGVYTWVYTKIL